MPGDGCKLCGQAGYHRHCVICGKALNERQRLFCCAEHEKYDQAERRRLRSVRCLVQPEDGSGRKMRAWVPKRLLGRMDNRLSRPSGAVGADLDADPPIPSLKGNLDA